MVGVSHVRRAPPLRAGGAVCGELPEAVCRAGVEHSSLENNSSRTLRRPQGDVPQAWHAVKGALYHAHRVWG